MKASILSEVLWVLVDEVNTCRLAEAELRWTTSTRLRNLCKTVLLSLALRHEELCLVCPLYLLEELWC